jgi:hypothetical protein
VGKNRVAKKQLLDIYGLDYVKEMKKLRAVWLNTHSGMILFMLIFL